MVSSSSPAAEKALQNSHSSPVPSGTMMMKQFVRFSYRRQVLKLVPLIHSCEPLSPSCSEEESDLL